MKKTNTTRLHTCFLAGLAILLVGTALPALASPEAGLKARADRERLLAHAREHGADARRLLFETLRDPRAPIRRVAAHQLARIGEPASAELIAAFRHPDIEIRRIAAYGMIEHDLMDALWSSVLRDALPWNMEFLEAHHFYLAHVVDALNPEQRTLALRGLARTLSEQEPDGLRPFRRFIAIVREQQMRRPSRRSLQWAGPPRWQTNAEPVAFWSFGLARDGRVPDLSGNGFHLRVVSDSDEAPVISDHALLLTPNVHVDGRVGRELGDAFTLDLWVSAEEIPPRAGFARWRGLAQLSGPSDARLRLRLNVAALHLDQRQNTGVNLIEGEWQRITLVRNRDRVYIYVNGEPTRVRGEPFEPALGPLDFSMGPMHRETAIWVEEAAFYPYALSRGEVALNIDVRAGLEWREAEPEPPRRRRAPAPSPEDDDGEEEDPDEDE